MHKRAPACRFKQRYAMERLGFHDLSRRLEVGTKFVRTVGTVINRGTP
jgi:hypothetical protein